MEQKRENKKKYLRLVSSEKTKTLERAKWRIVNREDIFLNGKVEEDY